MVFEKRASSYNRCDRDLAGKKQGRSHAWYPGISELDITAQFLKRNFRQWSQKLRVKAQYPEIGRVEPSHTLEVHGNRPVLVSE